MKNVSIKIAKILKDLGFDWSCETYYDSETDSIESTLDGYCYLNYATLEDLKEGDLLIPKLVDILYWLMYEYKIYINIGYINSKFYYEIILMKENKSINKSNCIYLDYDEALKGGIEDVLNKLISSSLTENIVK